MVTGLTSHLPSDPMSAQTIRDSYGIDVRTCGAIGDGNTDDSAAIQKALDAGSPRVVIPAGVYRVGRTLRVPSGRRIVVHRHARIVMADGAGVDRSCHLVANADPRRGNADIHIEGGIWDGNNLANPRGPDEPDSYTGVMMCFTKVRGFTLRDVTLINPESYYTRLDQVTNFWVEDIRLRATRLRPNQDGIHLGGGCEDGLIRRIDGKGDGVPNDDLVAVNPNDANHRAQNLGKTWGPVRRLHIDGLAAEDCHSFVRLLSVDDIIEDITISNLVGGCRVCVLNLDAGRQCAVPIFDENDPKYAQGAGLLRNVRVWNAQVHKSQVNQRKALIHLMTNPRNICVERFTRDVNFDASPDAPTLAINDVGPTRIDLEGLDAGQLDALVLDHPTQPLQSQPMAGLIGASHRAACAIGVGGRFTLPHGGFDRLKLTQA